MVEMKLASISFLSTPFVAIQDDRKYSGAGHVRASRNFFVVQKCLPYAPRSSCSTILKRSPSIAALYSSAKQDKSIEAEDRLKQSILKFIFSGKHDHSEKTSRHIQELSLDSRIYYRNDFIILRNSDVVEIYLRNKTNTFCVDLPFLRSRLEDRTDSFSIRSELNQTSDSERITTITITWRLEWVPPTLEQFMVIAEILPWMRVEYIDILPLLEQTSKFSWTQLGIFLYHFLFRGTLKMPFAVVPLQTTVKLKSRTAEHLGSITEIVETCSLVPKIRNGKVKNRRIASDFCLFADSSRDIENYGRGQWNDLVIEKLPELKQTVAGSGILDVEGLDARTQNNFIQGTQYVLFVMTLLVLSIGSSLAFRLLAKYHEQAQFFQSMDF